MKQIARRVAALLTAGVVVACGLTMSTPASAEITTTTCGTGPIQALNIKACVDVSGGYVRIYGIVGARGISEPPGTPMNVRATVSGEIVGGASLGSSSRGLRIWNNSFTVEGPTAFVACGSTVRATVNVTPGPSGPGGGGVPPVLTPVSIDVPVFY